MTFLAIDPEMAEMAQPASAAGRITIGADMTVNRLGFGAMRITGRGIIALTRDDLELIDGLAERAA